MRTFLFLLGFASVTHGTDKYLAFTTDYPPCYDTVGFDWLSRLEVFRLFDGQTKTHALTHSGHTYTVRWISQPPTVDVQEGGEILARIELSALLKRAGEYQNTHLGSPIPQNLLTEEAKTPKGRIRVYLEAISAEETGTSLEVHHLKTDVLFSSEREKAHSTERK
jgi:hypothetical protein